jgi:hypothetical protein
VAQPVEQRVAVGRVEHAVQRVLAARLARAVRHAQQVQVVVAQQAARRAAQRLQPAQHVHRVRAAVDQVAQQHQRVAAGEKSMRCSRRPRASSQPCTSPIK